MWVSRVQAALVQKGSQADSRCPGHWVGQKDNLSRGSSEQPVVWSVDTRNTAGREPFLHHALNPGPHTAPWALVGGFLTTFIFIFLQVLPCAQPILQALDSTQNPSRKEQAQGPPQLACKANLYTHHSPASRSLPRGPRLLPAQAHVTNAY